MEMNPMSLWTKKDLENAKSLAILINGHAQWNLSTQATMRLSQLLVWYNEMTGKIDQSIVEGQSVPAGDSK